MKNIHIFPMLVGLSGLLCLIFILVIDRYAKGSRKENSFSEEFTDQFFDQITDQLIGQITDQLTGQIAEQLKQKHMIKVQSADQNQSDDEYLATISNELRAPLGIMINMVQSVLGGIGGRVTETQQQNLKVILNLAKKLQGLINDLQDVAKINNGGIVLNPVPTDLKRIVDEQIAWIRFIHHGEGIPIINEISEDHPLVFIDKERLRQILNKLISASFKYANRGTIRITALYGRDQTRVTMENTEVVIDTALVSEIFNHKEILGSGTVRKNDCFAMELNLIKHLIELHGGRIWIASNVSTGTRLCFTVPNSEVGRTALNDVLTGSLNGGTAENKRKPYINTCAAPSEGLQTYQIIAVDEDPFSLYALRNILQLNGYEVNCVNSSDAALEILQGEICTDLVILDMAMPELFNRRVLETIRSKYNMAELPVLVLTEKEYISLCFQAGANDFLTKPYESEELIARVRSLMKLKKAASQLVSAEMSFLQAQIKPHFIHNALGTISSICTSDPEKARSLILDLSDYLRHSFDFDSKNSLSSLSKELELVQAYLSIEQERFSNRLAIYYHLIDNLDCKIPMLTIQPLVENAVHHGVLCRLEGGEIHISVQRIDNRIRIEVSDDGVGMTAETIEELLKPLDEQRDVGNTNIKRRRRVGIANINRRLTALYGEGLSIESAVNRGTSVSFQVPCAGEESGLCGDDYAAD